MLKIQKGELCAKYSKNSHSKILRVKKKESLSALYVNCWKSSWSYNGCGGNNSDGGGFGIVGKLGKALKEKACN